MFKLKENYKLNSNNKSVGKITIYSELVIDENNFDKLQNGNSYIPKRLCYINDFKKIKKGLKR